MEQGTGIEPVSICQKTLYSQCFHKSVSIFISIFCIYCVLRNID